MKGGGERFFVVGARMETTAIRVVLEVELQCLLILGYLLFAKRPNPACWACPFYSLLS